MTGISDWLSSLINTDPRTQSYPTEGLRQEAEAIHYLAASLRDIYLNAHSNDPGAKRLMYENINKSYSILSGKKVAEPVKPVQEEKAAKPLPPSYIDRVKATVEFLNSKKDELRKSRLDEFPKYLKAVDEPGKRDPVSKMKPAQIIIDSMIIAYNEKVKDWNQKLPNIVKKLDDRYKGKIVPNRVLPKPEDVKQIHRDTGLSRDRIVDSIGVYVKHQEDLVEKATALEDGLAKAYAAFSEFENQINRAIDAYKHGGKAGYETLANKGIGLPYDPNLKEVKFIDLFKVKSLDEVRKEISEAKAKRAAAPKTKGAAKRPAARKVKRLKSPAEKDAPEFAQSQKPAAALKQAAPAVEKKS